MLTFKKNILVKKYETKTINCDLESLLADNLKSVRVTEVDGEMYIDLYVQCDSQGQGMLTLWHSVEARYFPPFQYEILGDNTVPMEAKISILTKNESAEQCFEDITIPTEVLSEDSFIKKYGA